MRRIVIFFFLLIISGVVHAKTTKSPLILLSIDGFAYDYIAKHQPTNILKFAQSGVKAKLLPVYPSKTFPNHLSIITGVYPVNHGIVHNSFYHPTLAKKYPLGGGKHNAAWLTAKPFWAIAEANEIKTAVYFWPESEAKGQGSQPSLNIPYNRKDSEKARFDKIIDWLKLPKSEAPSFIASYFSSIDDIGHKFGPNSKELSQAIAEFDELFGYFLSRLSKEIPYQVNLLVVSDHGMVEIDKNKNLVINQVFDKSLHKLINNKSLIVAESSTQLYLYFDKTTLNKEQKNQVLLSLNRQQKLNGAIYSVYQKNNYPKHWQFNKTNSIVPDIIIDMSDNGSFINEEYTHTSAGTHGYDAKDVSVLTAVFLASGPDIIEGRELNAFENIHIVPFMSTLLGIKELPEIDGKQSVLNPAIKIN